MRRCFAAPENEPASTTRTKASIADRRSILTPGTKDVTRENITMKVARERLGEQLVIARRLPRG
jgi:hypothetical protein